MGFFKAMKLVFGEDYMFWLVPTTPVMSINYYERLYSFQDFKSRDRSKLDKNYDKAYFAEDEYDVDKKEKAEAKRRANKEKRIIFAASILFGVWVYSSQKFHS